MSKYLETLPQYHFDRDDFCKVFGEVFTDDEIIDIDVMCGYPQNTENFLLYRWEDEFYIIHRDSGTIINWYKHLVRLLNLYQADLLNQNRKNIENGRTEYFVPGVKAQYEHARIISTKLSVELGKGIKSWWEV